MVEQVPGGFGATQSMEAEGKTKRDRSRIDRHEAAAGTDGEQEGRRRACRREIAFRTIPSFRAPRRTDVRYGSRSLSRDQRVPWWTPDAARRNRRRLRLRMGTSFCRPSLVRSKGRDHGPPPSNITSIRIDVRTCSLRGKASLTTTAISFTAFLLQFSGGPFPKRMAGKQIRRGLRSSEKPEKCLFHCPPRAPLR